MKWKTVASIEQANWAGWIVFIIAVLIITINLSRRMSALLMIALATTVLLLFPVAAYSRRFRSRAMAITGGWSGLTIGSVLTLGVVEYALLAS